MGYSLVQGLVKTDALQEFNNRDKTRLTGQSGRCGWQWTLPVWRRAAGFLRACEDFAFIKIMTWIIAQ
jgi:hypothetical protein